MDGTLLTGKIQINSSVTTDSTSTTTGAIVCSGGIGVGCCTSTKFLSVYNNLHVGATGLFSGTVDSTSMTTGTLVVRGGAGIAKNLHVGGSVYPVQLSASITSSSTQTINAGNSPAHLRPNKTIFPLFKLLKNDFIHEHYSTNKN